MDTERNRHRVRRVASVPLLAAAVALAVPSAASAAAHPSGIQGTGHAVHVTGIEGSGRAVVSPDGIQGTGK